MRVPDLNWPSDLFDDDAAVPSEARFVPPMTQDEPMWTAMRSRWTAARPRPEGRVLPFRPVLRANGFGEAA